MSVVKPKNLPVVPVVIKLNASPLERVTRMVASANVFVSNPMAENELGRVMLIT
jgi:hypothetical protein